jgi:DNA modification methylase
MPSRKSPTVVAELRPASYNPRRITDADLETLKRSMQKYGDLSGIVVNVRTGNLIGGHQRIKHLDPSWKILKRPHQDKVGTVSLGHIETPFGRFSYREVAWDQRTEKTANLAANKIQGDWDNEKLAPILQELVTLPEFELTGFTPQEANLIIESYPSQQPTENLDEAPALPEKPQTRLGQLWKLGKHRLLCADATDPDSWNRLMDDHKAQLAITDPPFGERYELSAKFVQDEVTKRKQHHKSWGEIEGDENTNAGIHAAPLIFENLEKKGSVYIFAGKRLLVDFVHWLDENRIHYAPFLVWDKGFPVVTWQRYHAEHELIIFCGAGSRPGGLGRWFGPKDETTVWRIPIDASGKTRMHPTQKPVALYERAMVNSSAPGEIVVDPFAGSGPLIIAAEKHRRRAYMMELDPAYCDVIVKRWMALTRQKPEDSES